MPGAREEPRINERGPLITTGRIEIAASADLVWSVMTEIERWAEWNPSVKWASLEGELEEGSRFRWKAGPGAITSVVTCMDRPRLLAWTGKTMGVSAIHIWRMQPLGKRTLLVTEESWEGLPASILRPLMQRFLDKSIADGLRFLKAEAERRSTSARPGEPETRH